MKLIKNEEQALGVFRREYPQYPVTRAYRWQHEHIWVSMYMPGTSAENIILLTDGIGVTASREFSSREVSR